LEKLEFMNCIQIIKGDITTQNVDAIVNAANASLLGGGGVDGAIHRAAGPGLLEECRNIGGCPTGEARITKGYNLPAKYVIHTVGPVYRGGKHVEGELLKSCYSNSLALARQYNISTIAFPSISTGAYRYPIEEASNIALEAINDYLLNNSIPKTIIIVCFDEYAQSVYKKNAAGILKTDL
jgi:O-acetyl-ADP-ribose deacetylase (regulator of RNase III)